MKLPDITPQAADVEALANYRRNQSTPELQRELGHLNAALSQMLHYYAPKIDTVVAELQRRERMDQAKATAAADPDGLPECPPLSLGASETNFGGADTPFPAPAAAVEPQTVVGEDVRPHNVPDPPPVDLTPSGAQSLDAQSAAAPAERQADLVAGTDTYPPADLKIPAGKTALVKQTPAIKPGKKKRPPKNAE